MIPSARFARLLVLALVCSTSFVGCARFFPRPMVVPPEAATLPGMADLKGETLTPENFAKAFPAIDSFIMSSRVLAKYRRILGKTYFELSMASAGPKLIRMAGRHPGDRTTVFDLVFNYPRMHVYLPLEGAYYRGDVSPEGSPFGATFGVEPWDIIPIVEIGRRLAYAKFTVERGPKSTTLVLSDQDVTADGLERVELDNASGLPHRVYWHRGDLRSEVVYEAWGIFKSIQQPDESHLLPIRFSIEREEPYAFIEVSPREEMDQYKVEPQLSKKTFELIFPRETTFKSLDDLKDMLGG